MTDGELFQRVCRAQHAEALRYAAGVLRDLARTAGSDPQLDRLTLELASSVVRNLRGGLLT